MYDNSINTSQAFASAGLGNPLGSQLLELLMCEAIVPGEPPGYQLCKLIYTYHPLGAILAEAPITRAQAQERILSVPRLGEERIIKQFEKTWDTIGKVGATTIINNLGRTSRIYGIASLGVGERQRNGEARDPEQPLDLTRIKDADLFFNVFDPLNTSGSLVLNQDPNNPDFLKQGTIYVAGQKWHPSRTIALMNEQPLFIDWTPSAFGFVGRSVYQRALYPLKTYVQTMITDQMIAQKCGLIVAKMATPSSFIDNIMQSMFGWKRGQIKAGITGQVLSIGTEEEVEALDLKNCEPAGRFARENVLKNIASAAGMPASIIAQETLTEGFGEGSEDAKKEASYLNHIRNTLQPAYDFMDRIVMRMAWTEDFFHTLWIDYPELAKIEYETWLHDCIEAFEATWPNLLIEPESEKSKTADVQFKAVLGMVETLLPVLDPENKSKLILWAAENANEREELFASKLDLDVDVLADFLEEQKDQMEEQAEAAAQAGAQPGAPGANGKPGGNGKPQGTNGVPKAPPPMAARS